jgi:hypothetical protein
MVNGDGLQTLEVLTIMVLDIGDVKQLFDEEINRFPLGKPLSKNGTLLKSSGSEVYIIIDGTRRLVSAKVFDKHHFRFQNVNLVTDSNLLSIPEGPAFR